MRRLSSDGTIGVALSSLQTQQARMRIIAENIANAAVTGRTPGSDPYQQRTPVLKPLKLGDGVMGVQVAKVLTKNDGFVLRHEPGNPAADQNGYVKISNVNTLAQSLDMKEAQRAYEASLNIIENEHASEKSLLGLIKR